MRRPLAFMLFFPALLTGVARAEMAPPASMGMTYGVSARPMARLELLFGLSRHDGGQVTRAQWRAFLAREVTPRFPDGLTVVEARGQWRGQSGRVTRENARMLIVWYLPDVDSETRIEAIRAAYKARFGQKSVMRVDSGSCVSF